MRKARKRKETINRINIIRYGFLLCNLLYMVIGLLLYGVSMWIRTPGENWDLIKLVSTEATLNYATMCCWLTYITTTSIVFVSLLGCCGTLTTNKYILGAFFLCLIFLLMILGLLSIFGFFVRGQIASDLVYQLSETFIRSYHGDEAANWESQIWRRLQINFQCCGVTTEKGFRDYSDLDIGLFLGTEPLLGVEFWRNHENETNFWPKSCCNTKEYFNCSKTDLRNSRKVYPEGCNELIGSRIQGAFGIISTLSILLCIIQILYFVILRKLESSTILYQQIEYDLEIDCAETESSINSSSINSEPSLNVLKKFISKQFSRVLPERH